MVSIPQITKTSELEVKLVELLQNNTQAEGNVWCDRFIPLTNLEKTSIQIFTANSSNIEVDRVTDQRSNNINLICSAKGDDAKIILDKLEEEIESIIYENRNLNGLLPKPILLLGIERDFDFESENLLGYYVISLSAIHLKQYKSIGEIQNDSFE